MVGTPPTCTAIGVSDTEWRIHGHHTYYVTVKAENSAGLTSYAVSDPYIHDVQTAARGIVLDIPTSSVSISLYSPVDYTPVPTYMTLYMIYRHHNWRVWGNNHIYINIFSEYGPAPSDGELIFFLYSLWLCIFSGNCFLF